MKNPVALYRKVRAGFRIDQRHGNLRLRPGGNERFDLCCRASEEGRMFWSWWIHPDTVTHRAVKSVCARKTAT